jgi:ParB family chromosome partitioning protein
MARKQSLGRGLAALLGEGTENGVTPGFEASAGSTYPGSTGVVDLPVTVIRRNPRQPRRAFDPAALDELAMSIASVGVVQPRQ